MNSIYINSHRITIDGNELVVDGVKVPIKLKRGLFGTLSGGISVVNNEIRIGKNKIVLNNGYIEVNGTKYYPQGQQSSGRQTNNQQVNTKARKYYLSPNDTVIGGDGTTLYRIVATKDIVDIQQGRVLVKKGEKGGYIASRDNLSEDGNCWVYDDAKVYGNSRVEDDARVCDKAQVFGNVIVKNSAVVSGKAEVYGNTSLRDNAEVSGNAEVYGNVKVSGNGCITDNAEVYGIVSVTDNAKITDNAEVFGKVTIMDNGKVCGNAEVFGIETISGNMVVGNSQSSSSQKPFSHPFFANTLKGAHQSSTGQSKWSIFSGPIGNSSSQDDHDEDDDEYSEEIVDDSKNDKPYESLDDDDMEK